MRIKSILKIYLKYFLFEKYKIITFSREIPCNYRFKHKHKQKINNFSRGRVILFGLLYNSDI